MKVTAKASILVVEDDPEQIRAYSRVLRGFRLTCVPSATAALVALNEHMPDLIILDHVLADGELGADFLPKLKEVAAHVPVIMISGTLGLREQIKALEGPRSAHYVLEKPVSVEELESTVKKALCECGMGEAVDMLKSLEHAEKEFASEPERRFTERLDRQHELLNQIRDAKCKEVSISALSRDFGVDRKTIRRDIQDLIRRGQLEPECLPEADQ
jgi:DNA-binding NtrC family response regulator